MKRLLIPGILSIAIAGCTSPTKAKPVSDLTIDTMATARCLVMTNFGSREFANAFVEAQLRRAKRLGHETKDLKDALHHLKNGGPKSMYERVLNNWQSKDCKNALVTTLAVYFPEDKGARYTTVLMADGFFDEGRDKLSKPIYELCDEYEGMC